MKFSLTHSSQVSDSSVIHSGFQVNKYFEYFFRALSELSIAPELDDWELIYRALYIGGERDIKIFKKTKSDTIQKQKVIVVHIPIPSNEGIKWGISKHDIIIENFSPDVEKFSIRLPVLFDSIDLEDHIYKCIEAGILYSLSEGFTISGKKISVKQDSLKQLSDTFLK